MRPAVMKRAVAARSSTILAATVAVVVAAVVVGCSSDPAGDGGTTASTEGSAALGSGTVPDGLDIEVELRTSEVDVPLGAPLEYTIAIRNDGAKSVSVPVEVVLAPPSGDDVSFYATTLFAPAGDEVTEDGRVTPSQWFAERGRYTVAVNAFGHAAGDAVEFDVADPTVIVPVFEDVTGPAGVTTSVPEATCGQFSNGAAWGDVDGDDDADLFVTRLDDPTLLFINDGAGAFVDESEERGLSITDANGAAFADYDNDGDADLIVVRDGTDLLFANDGDGRFSDVSAAAGIGDDGYRRHERLVGRLRQRRQPRCLRHELHDVHRRVGHRGGDHLPGRVLLRTRCTATTATARSATRRRTSRTTRARVTTASTIGAGFGAAWFDYDGDGRLDLYLANDFVGPSPDNNRLWHNDGPVAGDPVDGGQINREWGFTDVSRRRRERRSS